MVVEDIKINQKMKKKSWLIIEYYKMRKNVYFRLKNLLYSWGWAMWLGLVRYAGKFQKSPFDKKLSFQKTRMKLFLYFISLGLQNLQGRLI